MKTFADRAYDLLRKVPKGRVTTYKDTGLLPHPVGLGDFKERHLEPLYRKK